jgi:hypothetical protein
MSGSLIVAVAGLVVSFVFSAITYLRQRGSDLKADKKDESKESAEKQRIDLDVIRASREAVVADNEHYRNVVVPSLQADTVRADTRADQAEAERDQFEAQLMQERRGWARERADLIRDNDVMRRRIGVLEARLGEQTDGK